MRLNKNCSKGMENMKKYYFLIQDKKQGMKSKTESMFPKIFMKARSIFDAIYGQHFPISICSMHLHSVITLIIYFFKYILLFLSVVQSAFPALNSNCLHIKCTHTWLIRTKVAQNPHRLYNRAVHRHPVVCGLLFWKLKSDIMSTATLMWPYLGE